MMLGLLVAAHILAAQDAKPGCDPTACSPGDTKVNEAQVITELRGTLQLLSNELGKGLLIPVGKDDQESLTIITEYLSRIDPEEKQYSGSPAQVVKQVQQRMTALRELEQ